jgi:probable rRNA maturation factor
MMKIGISDEAGLLAAGYKAVLKKIAKSVLRNLDAPKDSELSISFIDDEKMRELNRAYRNIDRTTDVLTFPQGGGPDMTILGDIVISVDTADRNSRRYGITREVEIKKLIVHGILHLFGYDHKKKKERDEMREKEKEVLLSLERL